MRYVFLSLFILMSLWHLYYSWKDEKRGRACNKPFLLVFLTLYYVFSTGHISWLLLSALITSWLGDVLLIVPGNLWVTLGGFSFGAGHILFILAYASQIIYSNVIWTPVILLSIVYLAISGLILSMVWKTSPAVMRVNIGLYLLANSTMNIFALMQLLTNPSIGAVLAYIGAVLFFVSDCCLFLVRFYKGEKQLVFKKHFTVMLTYLAGEFLITQGMLLVTG